MNAKPRQSPTPLWHQPSPAGPPAPGYDAWLKTELAKGEAQLDAGQSTALGAVRKEFGLE